MQQSLHDLHRTGARHGPAQMREMSRLIRQIHYPSMIDPFKDYRIADIGEAPINSLSIPESLERIENFVQQIVDAGALPLAAGGDHTISLPILRAVAKKAPLSKTSTSGSPTGRARSATYYPAIITHGTYSLVKLYKMFVFYCKIAPER